MDYQYGKSCREELVPFLPDGYHRILEVGCAYGAFRENLKQKNEYWGIEPSEFASRTAAQNLDKVLVGGFDEVYDQLPDKYFDLVICNDVIEHLPDHNDFFEKVKGKMTDDSVMVGAIPNVRHIKNLFNLLIKKDWQYQENGILDYTHLRFFTQKSLLKIFDNMSYKVEQIGGINEEAFKWTLKYFAKYPVYFVFGNDLKYTQFAFRVRPAR